MTFTMLILTAAMAINADEPTGTPLPEAPKAEAKSEHKILQPDKTLILETKPDGTKRVLVQAAVCLREGPLELFACKKKSKEHEAIVATEVDAQLIHAALVAAGSKPGKPVQWVKPGTEETDYQPASGGKIVVSVCFTKDGKAVTMKAQEWILDAKTKKPMVHEWVFAGSRLVKNPEKPEAPAIYTANLGEVISVANFPDSMLELPMKSTNVNDDLLFMANTEKIPPLASKIWIILEPVEEKK
jgi:hypothetical protein